MVGCVYAAQGLEFDDVGAIVDPDVDYQPMDGGWVGQRDQGHDRVVRPGVTEAEFTRYSVRNAYSTGADDPYDNLRRAFCVDISDAAWATVNSNISRHIPCPATGKVAVKVINHHADGVRRVITP